MVPRSFNLLLFTTVLLIINCEDIPNPDDNRKLQVSNNEFIKYAQALGETISVDKNKEFPREDKNSALFNATEHNQKIHDWLLANPDVHSKFEDVKQKEVKILRELYKLASNPDPKIPETTRLATLKKIAQKEEYLTGLHSDKFELSDINRLMHLVKSHMDDEDDHRLKVLRMQALDNRVKKIHQALKDSQITHKNYMDAHFAMKPKRFTHVPYPMSHKHMLDVWMHHDNMTSNFDVALFFEVHDLNDDELLDTQEVDALLVNYWTQYLNATDEAELIRMRKEVYNHIDTNKDGLISLEEIKREDQDKEQDEKEWTPDPNDPEYTDSKGNAVDDYKTALEELEKNKPNPEDTELMMEWEATRRDLLNLYQDIQKEGQAGAGGVH